MKEKIIGILGGMGPEATALLFQRILELTPAKRDQDHLPIIIYNNPKLPDRTEAIVGRGESPLPAMLEGLAKLEKMGADFVVIPCNTAFYWYNQLQNSTEIPIVNLIDEVVRAARDLLPKIKRVGLLATTTTVKANLYQQGFSKQEIEVIVPEEWEQRGIMEVIYRIKGGKRDSEAAKVLAESLVERGAKAVILGCTELSLIQQELDLGVPIVDSVQVLAQVAVEIATGVCG